MLILCKRPPEPGQLVIVFNSRHRWDEGIPVHIDGSFYDVFSNGEVYYRGTLREVLPTAIMGSQPRVRLNVVPYESDSWWRQYSEETAWEDMEEESLTIRWDPKYCRSVKPPPMVEGMDEHTRKIVLDLLEG